MSSVEFTTKIEHGVIHLPKEFKDYEDAVAHVTITLETPEDNKVKKDRLFAAFKKAQEAGLSRSKTLLNGRKLRDEWD